MDYLEVCFCIEPFKEEYTELLIAQISEMPFDSFVIENSCLKAYIPKESFSDSLLEEALSSVDYSSLFKLDVTCNSIEHQNWNSIWESSFNPIVVSKRCTIKAGFHKNLPKTKYNITIDPKMAFGTGHHQTTHLMIESMLSIDFTQKKVLDMGCGTGILAMLAAKMGAKSPVDAVDIDPIAVDSTIENSRRNRVSHLIDAKIGDVSIIHDSSYDIILANINRNIILADIESYYLSLNSGGLLLLSGFYDMDIPYIVKAAEKYSLRLLSTGSKDNWVSILFKKD